MSEIPGRNELSPDGNDVTEHDVLRWFSNANRMRGAFQNVRSHVHAPRHKAEKVPTELPYELTGIISSDQFLSGEHFEAFWGLYNISRKANGGQIPSKWECIHTFRRLANLTPHGQRYGGNPVTYRESLGLRFSTRKATGFPPVMVPGSFMSDGIEPHERTRHVIQVGSLITFVHTLDSRVLEVWPTGNKAPHLQPDWPEGINKSRFEYLSAMAAQLETQIDAAQNETH